MYSVHLLKYFKLANQEDFNATLYVRDTLKPKDSERNSCRRGWHRADCPQLPGFSTSAGPARGSLPDTPAPAAALLSSGPGSSFLEPRLLPLSSYPWGRACFRSYDL